jgi:hypothetical protein
MTTPHTPTINLSLLPLFNHTHYRYYVMDIIEGLDVESLVSVIVIGAIQSVRE